MSQIPHTPELRTDPITGRQVIIAPERSHRPGAFTSSEEAAVAEGKPCPFCLGNESLTPPAVLTLPGSTADLPVGPSDSWSLRVVPNLYPATFTGTAPRNRSRIDSSMSPVPNGQRSGAGRNKVDSYFSNDPKSATEGTFHSQPNAGRHEVVIETNRHLTQFTDLSVGEAEQAFLAYAYRFRAWQSDPRICYGIAFKNNGRPAGASIDHVHSQLMGLEVLPNAFVAQWKGSLSYFERQQECVFCNFLEYELADKTRVVDDSGDFVVVCPYASRLPYEMWIVPRTHSSHFERESDFQIRSVAQKVHASLTRLTQLIDNVPFNYLIHTAPFDISHSPHYHWHIEIIPRIAQLAGFELGSGCHLNPVSPEKATAQLQTV